VEAPGRRRACCRVPARSALWRARASAAGPPSPHGGKSSRARTLTQSRRLRTRFDDGRQV